MSRAACFALSAALLLPVALPAQETDQQAELKAILKDKPLEKWTNDLKSANITVRQHALEVLGKLGPLAKDAEPALLAALKEAKSTENLRPLIGGIATTLSAIGADPKPAIAALVPLLHQGGWGLDPNALIVLKVGGSPAEETTAVRSLLLGQQRCTRSLLLSNPALLKQYSAKIMPGLVVLLKDPDANCRDLAMLGLASYGKEAGKFGPALVQLLEDKDVQVRIQAAAALAAVDPGQKQKAIAVLIAALEKTDAVNFASQALRQIGVDALPSLLPHLREKTGAAQAPYIQALTAMGELAVAPLAKELTGETAVGRLGAARVLGMLGYYARPAFDNLVALLNDPAPEVRFHAAQALVWIDTPKANLAVPNLIAGLETGNGTIPQEAVATLSRLGKSAVTALPALRKMLRDPKLGLQAALAMVNIDPTQAVEAVPVLTASLEASVNQFPFAQITALKRIGPPAAAAAPALRKFLTSKRERIRIFAASALARVTPENAPEAVKALLDVFGHTPNEIEAIVALGELGPAARDALPLLKKVVVTEQQDPDMKQEALAAVLKIDPTEVAAILPRIKEDLQSKKIHVFRNAIELLCASAPAMPAEAAPLLAGVLKDQRARNRWDEVIEVLGNLGPAARTAAPALEERLKTAGPGEVQQIKDVLARINQPAKKGVAPK
jgi:HEAT repeat protein